MNIFEIWTKENGQPVFHGKQRATNFVEACSIRFGMDLDRAESGAVIRNEKGYPSLKGATCFMNEQDAAAAVEVPAENPNLTDDPTAPGGPLDPKVNDILTNEQKAKLQGVAADISGIEDDMRKMVGIPAERTSFDQEAKAPASQPTSQPQADQPAPSFPVTDAGSGDVVGTANVPGVVLNADQPQPLSAGTATAGEEVPTATLPLTSQPNPETKPQEQQ